MSHYLLDTHVLLWWFTDDPRLSERARTTLTDTQLDMYVSAASMWEIATKVRIGKLTSIPHLDDQLASLIQKNRFGTLDITANHARLAGSWDVPHRDPFDRMLAAQSQIEQMPLLTRDPAFNQFGITTLW